MRNQIVVQTIAASLTVLTIGSACSTKTSSPPDAEQVNSNTSALLKDNIQVAQEQNILSPEIAEYADADLAGISRAASTLQAPSNVARESKLRSIAKADTLARNPSPQTTWIPAPDPASRPVQNTEKYQTIVENPVVRVAEQSTSTFSIDVDTGAYANARRFLKAGHLPPADAVRIEEMLNYFSYNYDTPEDTSTPFSINTELSSTPWNKNTRLLHIGLKGFEIDKEDRPAANLVFLIDVSGSMSDPNKLGLLKSSIQMLSNELTEKDRVSIVVYAGASGVVLEPTAGNNFSKIRSALQQPGGSTNGEAGINLAYDMAERNKSENSINRIILATDGDFNVGISDIEKLKKLVERKRQSGIALTTLGFGQGNYNDHLMEQLSNVGNGSYAYIDTLSEARKVLSEELTSTLLTIAKDVKIQIEFNPAQVQEYRLLGYVNRRLNNEDFANDRVDAGEIGAGHTVTALYEIALAGENGAWHSESRYQNKAASSELGNEVAIVRLRYKAPNGNKSQLTEKVVSIDSLIDNIDNTSDNFRFSAAVAGFGQLLRNDKYVVDFDFADSATLAATAKGQDRFGYRSELVQLIDLANSLTRGHRAMVNTNNIDKEG